jgi:hypothetical protein
LIFKKFKNWFPSLTPSESLYKKIDNETKSNTRWLPNSLNVYNMPKERGHQNGSFSSPNLTNDTISKSSPPESGIWTSQASSNSPILRENDALKSETQQNRPVVAI